MDVKVDVPPCREGKRDQGGCWGGDRVVELAWRGEKRQRSSMQGQHELKHKSHVVPYQLKNVVTNCVFQSL